MKIQKLFLLLVFAFVSSSAFSQDIEAQVKKMLQGRINAIFHKWDDEEWSWDNYVDESAIISTMEESTYSDDRVIVKGSFKVTRPLGGVSVRFEAKIVAGSTGITILNLCYADKSVEMQDCCDPSDWGLQQIAFN